MEEEEIRTYSKLIGYLRERLLKYMSDEARAFESVLRSIEGMGKIKVDGHAASFGTVVAVDSGSSIISLAERHIAMIAALAIIDLGTRYEREVEVDVCQQRILSNRYDARLDMCDSRREPDKLRYGCSKAVDDIRDEHDPAAV